MNIQEELLINTPFPLINNETQEIRDGVIYSAPSFCIKNRQKLSCKNFHKSLTEGQVATCPFGFLSSKVSNDKWQIIGMIDTSSSIPKDRRDANRANVIAKQKITKWVEVTKYQVQSIAQKADQETGDALHVLHDIRILNRQIKINAEREIRYNKGLDLADAFEVAPHNLKSIYKASELLTGQLELISFYYNPSQINRGKKSYIHVYKLFDKVKRIYQVLAEQKKININMIGSSTSEAPLFESATILPQILIDNAVKYSLVGGTVDLSVTEENRYIHVGVSSFGPRIEDDEKDKIFSRRSRGIYAERSGIEGSGIGLWVASKVCEYNNIELELKVEPSSVIYNNTPYSQNKFLLKITK